MSPQLKECRVSPVIDDPQKFELITDGLVGIQPTVRRTPSFEVSRLSDLRHRSYGRRFVQETLAQLDSLFTKSCTNFTDELVAFKHDPVLIQNRAGINLISGLDETNRNHVLACQNRPG